MFSTTALAMVAAATPALWGCSGNAPSSQSSSESLGTVRADLIAVGPNGVQYDMPTNSSLALTPVDTDAAAVETSELTFASGMMVQNFSVPPGQYTATLQGGPPWALQNLTDGTTADATLLDQQPYNLTITPGATTVLSFHFALAGVGNVTFGTGTLQTSLSVEGSDGGAPTTGNFAASLGIQGLANINAMGTTGKTPGAGNAAIENLVTSSTPATFTFGDTPFQITSGFTAGVDVVCATITVPPVKPQQEFVPDAGLTGAIDLFDEAVGIAATSAGELCLYDSSGEVPNGVVLQFSRSGPPTTPTVQKALAGTGSGTYTFISLVVATSPTALYDGTTADLTALASPTTLTVQETETFFDYSEPDEVDTIGTTSPQTLTLQLTP
jgi:hypothetical protein